MKAKRLVSCVCALAITAASMATCVVSAADSQVVLKGEHIEKTAGSEFSLTIDLAELNGEAKQGFSGCEFAITYDPAKLSNVTITEGAVFSSTDATAAEVAKAPKIGDEVGMINGSAYNCFDYNIVEKDGKSIAAVLWCTGLESSKYWAKSSGTLLTVSGKVYADAKVGEEIPLNIVAIDRDGNEDIVFGYIDGTIDTNYTTSVEQDALIKIVDKETPEEPELLAPLWGDVNNDGRVKANDLVAMVQFILNPKTANISKQGLVNGNLFQGDKNTDLESDDIMDASDLFLLKRYLLGDVEESAFPVMNLSAAK